MTDQASIAPAHVAIILDGNGRWAKKRGLPRTEGHRRGAANVQRIARACRDRGIRVLTLYCFSTENWSRPDDEVAGIMNLLRRYLDDADNYRRDHIRLRVIGDRSRLAPDIVEKIADAERQSDEDAVMTLNLAINYGGREELTHAARALASLAAAGEIEPDAIKEEDISAALYTAGLPELDLMIRPSGEQRLSNFLLWQCAYAEFVFQDVLWPDYSEQDLDEALAMFGRRNRRFGGI